MGIALVSPGYNAEIVAAEKSINWVAALTCGFPPAETKTTLSGTRKSTRHCWMAGEYAIHHSLGPTDYSGPGPSCMTNKGYIGGNNAKG